MRLFKSFAIAGMALAAHKTRTLLASLGIVIGIAAVILMVSIGSGSKKEVMDLVSDMGENLITINAGEMKRRGGRLRLSGMVTTLTPGDARAMIDEVPAILRVAPFDFKPMQVKYRQAYTETNMSGSTEEFMAIRKYEVASGEGFSRQDAEQGRRVGIIGLTALNNIFGGEDPVGQTVRVMNVPIRIVGVFRSKGLDSDGVDQDDFLLVPLRTLMRRVLNQRYISTIYAQAVSRQRIPEAIRQARDLLRRRHRLLETAEDDFTIVNQIEQAKLKAETAETFTRLIVGVAAISLMVGGIGILAVMLISVKERTREIGLRRALGATRGEIVRQFLAESVMIGILGGAVGVGLGVGLTLAAQAWGPWTLLLNWNSVYVSSGVCVLIGTLFGIYPAVKASRLDPMSALTVE